MQRDINGALIGWFVGGALLGATVALLLAPKTGEKLRKQIGLEAESGGKSLLATGQDLFERGRELFQKGREIAEEAAEMFERTRGIAEKKIQDAV